MEINKAGSQAPLVGAVERYTGAVRIDPLFPEALAPSRATSTVVTFEPGARTVWHTHPLGQTLVVTAGCGRVQCLGGPVQAIRPGDAVRIAPGEKHWHGAAPATAMTHIAVQEALDGSTATWLEPVDEALYVTPPQ